MDFHPTAYSRNLQVRGGIVPSRTFHRTRFERFQSFYYQNLTGHYGCVNAIEFSSRNGSYLASGGDDRRVLLWNVSDALFQKNYRPLHMNATHLSNIFCLSFNRNDTKLVSSGNDGQVILHDLSTNNLIDVFMCDNSVYGLSVHPDNDNLVAAACEDGTVYIMDTRLTKSDSICLARETSAFHSVMFSPLHHHLVVTSHSRDGVALWDIRSPKKEVLHYGSNRGKQRAMSARFNHTGDQLICLRRRLPLALYNVNNSKCVAEFGAVGYSNSCTMKCCCFAGDKDQYVVSGSDDFGVYIWKLPGEKRPERKVICKPSKILKGHRSIVNQVRFNACSNMLVSCGVEKIVKLWSTERLPLGDGELVPPKSCSPPRKRYSHTEYLQLILDSSRVTHDYESENTQEDSRMLAFFDSLVQHEADACETDSSNSDYDMMTVAQRNAFFVTGGVELSSSASSDSSDEEGPASLQTLGINKTSSKPTDEKSQALQAKLRTLRARLKTDETWQAPVMPSPNTSDDEEQQRDPVNYKQFQPCHHDEPDDNRTEKCDIKPGTSAKRKQKSVAVSPKRVKLKKDKSTSGGSESEGESSATRMRQRNARRRVRKSFRPAGHVVDECTPGPSGSQNLQHTASTKTPQNDSVLADTAELKLTADKNYSSRNV